MIRNYLLGGVAGVLCGIGGHVHATHNTSWDYRAFCDQVEAGAIPANTVSVRDPLFDVVGEADDLGRMRRAATHACTHPRTTLVYPPGTYRIDQLRDALDRNISHWGVLYHGCSKVRVVGCRAKIDVKGDFHKTKTQLSSVATKWYANEVQMIPFLFENSNHFVLQGFEVDGNTDEMTMDPEINSETFDDGILTVNSHDYRIADIYVHHFAADGLTIGSGTLDYNFTIDRVESANNGRDALSLLQIRDGVVKNSILREAGNNGAYKKWTSGDLAPFQGFSPSAGVGIEPDCKLPPIPGTVCPNRKGGHVIFENCRILNNAGNGLSSTHSDVIEDITLRRSVIQNPPDSTAYPLFLGDGVVEDTVIQAEQGPVTLSGSPSQPEDEVIFRGNTVSGGSVDNYLFDAHGNQLSVLIEDNMFIGGYSLGPAKLLMILVQAPEGKRRWRFVRNWIGIPANAHAPNNTNNFIGFGRLLESTGNRFWSFGPTPWVISYDGTQIIRDQFTRPDGLVPRNYGQPQPNLSDCVDANGFLTYVEGISTCAQ